MNSPFPKSFPVMGSEADGVVSWVHFGDLHMTTRDKQNYYDFLSLIQEVNRGMAGSMAFAYLPGDNTDHGTAEEYECVRSALSVLRIPYFAIVGDHDVRGRSFGNFRHFLMPDTHYYFSVGPYRFFALNALPHANPKRFDLSLEQLEWLQLHLDDPAYRNRKSVLFLHCYPSELVEHAVALRHMIHNYPVLLVDMGHTHYNEIANDGKTLYTATRSTGQVEEGPVGFSITNIDSDVVSWKFKPLGWWPLAMITAPADLRLITDPMMPNQVVRGDLKIRVKAWGDAPIVSCELLVDNQVAQPMLRLTDSHLWELDWNSRNVPDGVYSLQAIVADAQARRAADEIRVVVNQRGDFRGPERAKRDQDNAIGAWVDRGVLGTRLGPNKNGRKW
jgi:Icc protein